MISSLMALAIRERVVVLGMALMLLAAGIFSFSNSTSKRIPIRCTPSRGDRATQWSECRRVEKLVTVPT